MTLVQPDGAVVHCFASGDEYLNWYHDKAGYTIVPDRNTGYYTYAVASEEGPVASQHIVGRSDPAAAGLAKRVVPSAANVRRGYLQKFAFRDESQYRLIENAPHTGTFNNLAVFIRFSDESEFSRTIDGYQAMFNYNAPGMNSTYNYFQEVSYGQLSITTTFYPPPSNSYVVSYQDSLPRAYYRPYNSVTNTLGYQTDEEATTREHTLLANAIAYVAASVPSNLPIDADGDGNVDNVVFIVKGQPDGWSDLLWPHRWSLYTQTVMLNGKRVYTYNLQLETALDSSGVGVLCHEMFHSLGSPDLYHYSQDGLQPVGRWDLMEQNLNPPQHMLIYMKQKYGQWLSSIPVISAPGMYTLNPATSATGNAFRINSPNSSTEYFIVEYRKRSGTFETSLPGEGLLVYRINSTVATGNRNGPPDEVYVYRPGGTTTVNGTPNLAPYSSNSGRTSINDATSPSSFLSDGSAGGLNISNVTAIGDTISFTLGGGSASSCTSTQKAQVANNPVAPSTRALPTGGEWKRKLRAGGETWTYTFTVEQPTAPRDVSRGQTETSGVDIPIKPGWYLPSYGGPQPRTVRPLAKSTVATGFETPLEPAAVDFSAVTAYLTTVAGDGGTSITTPAVGQPVYFTIDFDVAGGSADLQIQSLIDNAVFCGGDLGVVDPGSFMVYCQDPWTMTAGSHTLRWELDHTNVVTETDENNNVASVTFGSSSGTDLAATRAYFKDAVGTAGVEVPTPTVGQVVYPYIGWTLTASAPVTAAKRATIDGVEHCKYTATNDPGVGTNWASSCGVGWTATAGTHTLEYTLDSDNVIAETSETNNSASKTFTSSTPATYDIVAQRAYLRTATAGGGTELDPPALGQAAYFHVDWQVTGTGTSTTVSQRASLDGTPFCSCETTATVGFSYASSCAGPWTAATGPHTLQWDLDYTGTVTETNESNNSASKAFTPRTAVDARRRGSTQRRRPYTASQAVSGTAVVRSRFNRVVR
ncbi:MAG: M6 family metalloprotease domain-containing protein [Terriglobales bacterium]